MLLSSGDSCPISSFCSLLAFSQDSSPKTAGVGGMEGIHRNVHFPLTSLGHCQTFPVWKRRTGEEIEGTDELGETEGTNEEEGDHNKQKRRKRNGGRKRPVGEEPRGRRQGMGHGKPGDMDRDLCTEQRAFPPSRHCAVTFLCFAFALSFHSLRKRGEMKFGFIDVRYLVVQS